MADDMTPVPVIADAVDEAEDKKSMSRGIRLLEGRAGEFPSTLAMKLAGIGMVPEARDMVNARLSGAFERTLRAGMDGSEVIIGGGLHAAVYAAARVRAGFPRPVVLERNAGDQVGGAFAVSLSPVFWLNSTNKPGRPGVPGSMDALNYLPGGLIQPSDIARGRFPSNADVAFAVRLMLAQYAVVLTGITVTGYTDTELSYEGRKAGTARPGRILDMRGMGDPFPGDSRVDGIRVVSFPQFMRRMGAGGFPLRGLGKVAVIGGGDSGKCAVESLLNLAPPSQMGPVMLDYVRKVDWYAPNLPVTVSSWRAGQKGRYIQIGSCLPRDAAVLSSRLTVRQFQAYAVPLPDGALVAGDTYDLAVVCAGSTRPDISAGPFRLASVAAGGGVIARRRGERVFMAGTAAEISFSDDERRYQAYAGDANNTVAIFRLAPRTAALAAMLGKPEEEE